MAIKQLLGSDFEIAAQVNEGQICISAWLDSAFFTREPKS